MTTATQKPTGKPANGPATAAPSTQAVRPKEKTAPQALRELLERSREQIAVALPRHLTPERMIRVALTAFQNAPDLWNCDLITVVGGVIQASQLGLEIGGALGQCYLVPFYNGRRRVKEAQFIIGYKGYLTLARRSGEVKHFSAHVVHENDQFSYEYGTNGHLRHVPARKNRGGPTEAYAVLRLKDGGDDFEVLSWEEILDFQKEYRKEKGDGGPWMTDLEEMAKKTAIRRLAKRCPVSVEVQTAASLDEYASRGVDQGLRGFLPALTRTEEVEARLGHVGEGEYASTGQLLQLQQLWAEIPVEEMQAILDELAPGVKRSEALSRDQADAIIERLQRQQVPGAKPSEPVPVDPGAPHTVKQSHQVHRLIQGFPPEEYSVICEELGIHPNLAGATAGQVETLIGRLTPKETREPGGEG